MKPTLPWIIFLNLVFVSMVVAAEPLKKLNMFDGKVQTLDSNAELGTSRAVIVDALPLAHTTQILPLDKDGKLIGEGDAAKQATEVLRNLGAAIEDTGSSLKSVVKLNLYVADDEAAQAAQKAIMASFRDELRPAVSLVVTRLPNAGALVAADAVAIAAEVKNSTRVSVLPAGKRIYISGQAEPGDLKTATRKTMESLRATLKFLGREDKDIVELKAFMLPMSAAEDVRQEIASFFGDRPVPPLSLVEWESKLPIEIELVAAGGPLDAAGDSATPSVEYLTPPGMQASPIYCRVARVNHAQTIYVGGLYGPQAGGGEQVEAIFATLKDIAKRTGSDLRHLVKATYYVANDEASRKLNELRPNYYDPQRPPAASKAMVSGIGIPGRTITIDMIAVPAK